MKQFMSIFLLAVMWCTASSTTANGRFMLITNNGSIYSVKVQLQVDVSTGLGGATLAFTFNTADLSFPAIPVAGTDYTYHAYSGGLYSVATVTRPLANKVSVNIEYNGSTGQGTPVIASPGWSDVVTISFTTTNPMGSSNLVWVTTQTIADDGITPWTAGTFTNRNDIPLPVQLSRFIATVVNQRQVRLDWTTVSEVNNYGFYVERRAQSVEQWLEVPNSFIAGHGTTNERHDYTFTDPSPGAPSVWYRLRQVDLDGTVHYTEPIQVSGILTSVEEKERAPIEFALKQNYPNPFNPSTEIKFSVETFERTSLEVFNIIGQKVATLFDDVAEPGQYYKVRFGGANLASGIYLYRLQSGKRSDLKKLLLLK